MDADLQNDSAGQPGGTTVERTSDRDLVVRRSVRAPVRDVFEAWTDPARFRIWWAPKSCGISIMSCEIDARTGGTYRLLIAHPAVAQPLAFFGRYLDVTPESRHVWTNEEGVDGGAVTTVTFKEQGPATLVDVRELYATKEALDEAIASQSTSGWAEQFEQLESLLLT
jgi:uncharacterized protein YndB with AHSA1/START domain